MAFIVSCLVVLQRLTHAEQAQQNQRRHLLSLSQYRDPSTTLPKNAISTLEPIEINPYSTVASDIQEIWHDRQQSKVCIQFKPEARCPHPSLVGRLSGKSIALLQWNVVEPSNDSTTSHCGSYNDAWLEGGLYFLEVIILHCNGFGLTKLDGIQSGHPYHQGMNEMDWLVYDFSNEFPEAQTSHRLTGHRSYVSISRDHFGVENLSKGHWALQDEALAVSSYYAPPPWYTRYQPQNCRVNDPDFATGKFASFVNSLRRDRCVVCPTLRCNILTDRCQKPMDNSRLSHYTFVWNDNQQYWIDQLELMKRQADVDVFEYMQFALGKFFILNAEEICMQYSNKMLHLLLTIGIDNDRPGAQYTDVSHIDPSTIFADKLVCILGDSHSVKLTRTMFYLQLGHKFKHAHLFYPEPHEATEKIKQYYVEHNCRKFVIATGQWPASFYAKDAFGTPFLFEHYISGLSEIVGNEELYEFGDGDIEIYLRNVHLNPIGDLVSNCVDGRSPEDWRTPTVLNAYNHLIKTTVDNV